MATRGSRFSGKKFVIQAAGDGSRQYYEHDDRGVARSSSATRSRGNYRNYRSGSKFRGGARGGRVWDGGWEDDRNSRFPEGHWRGNRRAGARGMHGPRRPQYKDDDADMSGNKDRSRRQDQYKRRGSRPHISSTNNRLGWRKVLIRDGADYDPQDVLEGIRSLVHEPFIPVLYEAEGRFLVFYLEDNDPAVQAITEISRRLTMRNGAKLQVSINSSAPPNRPLTLPQQEQVTQVMSARYSPEMKRLDLKNFHNDSTLVKERIFCPLYRHPNMHIVVNIIVRNIPLVEEIDLGYNKINSLDELERIVSSCPNLHRLSLKKNKIASAEGLDRLAGLQVTDLTLEDNPLCDRFRDSESYIRQVHWVTGPG